MFVYFITFADGFGLKTGLLKMPYSQPALYLASITKTVRSASSLCITVILCTIPLRDL